MGHLGKLIDPHEALRQRLDRYPVGAPQEEGIHEILSLLFSAEEAAIGASMPYMPSRIEVVATHCRTTPAELQPKLEHMAERGVVMDFVHPDTGATFWSLAPTVVGFVELSLSRRRDDLPQKRLAELYGKYIHTAPFMAGAFTGSTQIGRALVREDAIANIETEVLPYERATDIIREARTLGVALCYCRHAREHQGHPCAHPQEACLSLNVAAEYVIRRRHGRRIDAAEALDILARSRAEGLVQIADNVRQRPVFICNCCGCCCDQLRAISEHGLTRAVVTSNFLAVVASSKCNGCGLCVRQCPIHAIGGEPKPRVRHSSEECRPAVVDSNICLGCGVCVAACKHGALSMVPRPHRVLTPETTLDRLVRMTIERGKLHHALLGEAAERIPATFPQRLGSILRVTRGDDLRLADRLRSRFLAWSFGVFRRTVASHVDWF